MGRKHRQQYNLHPRPGLNPRRNSLQPLKHLLGNFTGNHRNIFRINTTRSGSSNILRLPLRRRPCIPKCQHSNYRKSRYIWKHFGIRSSFNRRRIITSGSSNSRINSQNQWRYLHIPIFRWSCIRKSSCNRLRRTAHLGN